MNETIKVPFDVKTAKNGDKYIHRSFGEVTYIGKHPTMEHAHIVLAPQWEDINGGFKTVLGVTMHTEKVKKTIWINVYYFDNRTLYDTYSYNSKEQALEKVNKNRHYVGTYPLQIDTVA